MTATQIVTGKTDSISFDLSRCRATWLYWADDLEEPSSGFSFFVTVF
jgi:hypothetical protein